MGLEVHVELNTKSKMFCRCSTDYFGKEPNSHTCPVCLGLPGALPYINKQAIDDCMKIGLALNCTISPRSLFERKNYFYPDLPKGYQISQYRWPLCVDGWIEVEDKEGSRKIRINRAHQEEDTGKLTHRNTQTLIDFNRSGVPLVEIVTEPDFRDVDGIRDYAKKLQQLFRYLGVSNADMERGDMRLEANVSVRKQGDKKLPNYRVELKNINSFRFMVAAVEYEINRQVEQLQKGNKLHQETRGWDEDKKCTYLQRSKEEAQDYRYFPEPDLPELRISQDHIYRVKSDLPELPYAKKERFEKEYGIPAYAAFILTRERNVADFYEQAVKDGANVTISSLEIANAMVNKRIDWSNLLPAQLVQALVKGKRDEIEPGVLEKAIDIVIARNKETVESFRKGKTGVLEFLVGQVLKETNGSGDPTEIRSKLLEKLPVKE